MLSPGSGIFGALFTAGADTELTTSWESTPSAGAPDEFTITFYVDGVQVYQLEQVPENSPWKTEPIGSNCDCDGGLIDYQGAPYA